jgi:hypothetical protein
MLEAWTMDLEFSGLPLFAQFVAILNPIHLFEPCISLLCEVKSHMEFSGLPLFAQFVAILNPIHLFEPCISLLCKVTC